MIEIPNLVSIVWIIGLLCSIWTLRAQKTLSRVEVMVVTLHALFFVFAVLMFVQYHDAVSGPLNLWQWVSPYHLTIFCDRIVAIMTLLLAMVSLCVQIYSAGYMQADHNRSSFMAVLFFFTFMMWTVLIAQNWILLFIGWEGMSVCSFLLIGFWREEAHVQNASVKALVINRIGDAAMIFGLCGLVYQYGTLDYLIFSSNHLEPIAFSTLCAFMIGIFAKSAQWPFHVWLPSSMVAPAPVSALLHAATLVTAGVILMIRLNPMIPDDSLFRILVQVVASWTIVLMGLEAFVQTDIKKVIAYSTISQLGYMCLAVAVGFPDLALYHLWTHGFFKSVLFLLAGIASNRCHHSQDLGDLKGVFSSDFFVKMLFLMSLLSLSGFPGFAGFYSKERIIHHVLSTTNALLLSRFAVILGACLTTLYCARLGAILLTPVTNPIQQNHASVQQDEISENRMLLAVTILGICSFIAGPIGETSWFGFCHENESVGLSFYLEAIHSGWIILFSALFLIVYRLFSAFIDRVSFTKRSKCSCYPLIQSDLYSESLLSGALKMYGDLCQKAASVEIVLFDWLFGRGVQVSFSEASQLIDQKFMSGRSGAQSVRWTLIGILSVAVLSIGGLT